MVLHLTKRGKIVIISLIVVQIKTKSKNVNLLRQADKYNTLTYEENSTADE